MGINFDPNFVIGKGLTMTGHFNHVNVIDPALGAAGQPNHVVNQNVPFEVDLEWEINGALAPLWLNAIDQSWYIKVFAETMGPGKDVFLVQDRLDKSLTTDGNIDDQNTYKHTVTVPAGLLEEGNPLSQNSGVYKLIVTVFLNSELGLPGFDITGFAEGPMIRVEDPL